MPRFLSNITDASKVTILDAGNKFTAIDVDGALDEIGTKLITADDETITTPLPIDADTLGGQLPSYYLPSYTDEIPATPIPRVADLLGTTSESDLNTQLGSKAPTVHTHTMSQITDYEEGTWTPQLKGFGVPATDPTCSYSLQYGAYTKIGRLVTCHVALIGQISVAGAGVLTFTLPFTANSSVLTYQHTKIGWVDNTGNILPTGISPIHLENLCAIYIGAYSDANISAGTTGTFGFSVMFSYTV